MSTTTRVTFRDLTKATEPDLRALNAVIFPVRYGDKFYEDCARAGPCTQLAYDANGACVGAVLTWFLTAKPLQCRIAHDFGPHLRV